MLVDSNREFIDSREGFSTMEETAYFAMQDRDMQEVYVPSPEEFIPRLGEFIQALKSHDWFYDYSDDPRAYARGAESYRKIADMMAQFKRAGVHDAAMVLYRQYEKKA